MSAYLKLCNAIFWLGIILWIGALFSGGLSAMHVFPQLDRLPLELERYPDFPVEHHPRLAAGLIMNRVFVTVDLLQLGAVPVVLVTLFAQLALFRLPIRTPSNLIRAGALTLAALLFVYLLVAVTPSMNRALQLFWEAAEAGETDLAMTHHAAFNRGHPTAERVQGLMLILLIVGAVTSAIALSPTPPPPRTGPAPLEPPRLLQRK